MLPRPCLFAFAVLLVPIPALAQAPDDSMFAYSGVNGETRAHERAPSNETHGPNVWDRVLSVNVQHGFGTPTGIVGFGVDVTPVRWFTLGGGIGYSFDGVQEAAMGRFRIPFDNGTAIAFGGGLSTGAYRASPFMEMDYSTIWTWKRAWWANAELSIEHRWRSGIELRGFAGAAFLTNPTADSCTARDEEAGRDETCPGLDASKSISTTVPYFGGALGYAFDL